MGHVARWSENHPLRLWKRALEGVLSEQKQQNSCVETCGCWNLAGNVVAWETEGELTEFQYQTAWMCILRWPAEDSVTQD